MGLPVKLGGTAESFGPLQRMGDGWLFLVDAFRGLYAGARRNLDKGE